MKKLDQRQALWLLDQQALLIEGILLGKCNVDNARDFGIRLVEKVKQFVAEQVGK